MFRRAPASHRQPQPDSLSSAGVDSFYHFSFLLLSALINSTIYYPLFSYAVDPSPRYDFESSTALVCSVSRPVRSLRLRTHPSVLKEAEYPNKTQRPDLISNFGPLWIGRPSFLCNESCGSTRFSHASCLFCLLCARKNCQ